MDKTNEEGANKYHVIKLGDNVNYTVLQEDLEGHIFSLEIQDAFIDGVIFGLKSHRSRG